MGKMEKLSILISILLISLIALSTVSAEDVNLIEDSNIALSDDALAIEEDQTVDEGIRNELSSQSSERMGDAIVKENESLGSDDGAGSDETVFNENRKSNNLGANKLSGNRDDLQTAITDANGILNLDQDYTWASSYYKPIDINKNLTINGGGHIIDALYCGPIFNINPDHTVIINNLTFRGSTGATSTSSSCCAIINFANLTLNNCKFEGNEAQIHTSSGGYTPIGATYKGGNGAGVDNRATLTVNSCIFNSNTAYYTSYKTGLGGAIYSTGTLYVTDSNFTGNKGEAGGGAIYSSGSFIIKNCIFENNEATSHALINVRNSEGGAIYNAGDYSQIENCTFNNNFIKSAIEDPSSGGAIYNSGTLAIMDCEFTGNHINNDDRGNGGAVANFGTMRILASNFTDNSGYYGGAVYNTNDLILEDSNFTENTASFGNSIFNDKNLSLSNNDINKTACDLYVGTNGFIESQTRGEISDTNSSTFNPNKDITAVIVDDAGNYIHYDDLKFLVDGEEMPYTLLDNQTGIYHLNYTFKNPGTVTVSASCKDVTFDELQISFESPLSNLQELIDNDEDGVIDLEYGYQYSERFDQALINTGVTINRNITIYGFGNAIDGNGTSRLFTITNNASVIFLDMIFRNAFTDFYGAVFVDNGRLLVDSSEFLNNTASYGGAIYNQGNLTVRSCIFANNSANSGGAIASDTDITIYGSEFRDNSASGIAAGAVYTMGKSVISDTEFINNTAISGGAIYNEGNLSLSNSNFTDNDARQGSGIYNKKELSLENNTMGSKTAIYVAEGANITSPITLKVLGGEDRFIVSSEYNLTAVISDDFGNTIEYEDFTFLVDGEEVSNTSFDVETGEYRSEQSFGFGTYDISGSYGNNTQTQKLSRPISLSLLQRMIDEDEDGIIDLEFDFKYVEGADYLIKDTGVLINKTITINGNGHSIDGLGSSRLFTLSNASTLTLNNITLKNGYSTMGGAVYADLGTTLNVLNSLFTNNSGKEAASCGGAIYTRGNLNISSSNFTDNKQLSLGSGGAIYANGSLENGEFIIIHDSIFLNNSAYAFGAILSVGQPLNISNSKFIANSAVYTGAIGASNETNITESIFENNSAYDNGGAILFADPEFSLNIEKSSFYNNSVKSPDSDVPVDGGAICVRSGTVYVRQSNFTQNSATYRGGAIFIRGGSLIVSLSLFDNNSASMGDAIASDVTTSHTALYESNISSSNISIYNCALMYMYDNIISSDESAVFNEGNLELSNNIMETAKVSIYNHAVGKILSNIYAVTMDNKTIHTYSPYVNLTGILLDDNNNSIYDSEFKFKILNDTRTFDSFDNVTGIYSKVWQFSEADLYTVDVNYENIGLALGKVSIDSLKTLEKLINRNTNGTLDLDTDYVYIDLFDQSINEGIPITKNITINGNYHILSGSNAARLFTVDSNRTLNLNNLIIMNCTFVSTSLIRDCGAAVYVKDSGNLNIDGSTFMNNNVNKNGGAICLNNSANMSVSNSKFMYNFANYSGGAIYANNLNNFVNISGCEFTNNFANQSGAAVSVRQSIINGSKFVGNAILSQEMPDGLAMLLYGGGALFIAVEASIDNCEFINNSAIIGGAIRSASLNVSNSIFNGNQAGIGGAIVYWVANSTIKNVNFSSNKAINGSAIAALASELSIDGANFTTNLAQLGGTILLYNASAFINNSMFGVNLGLGNNDKYYIDNVNSTLTLENNIFQLATATLSVEKVKYDSLEDVEVTGSFNWGVTNTPVTLGIVELNGKETFVPENFTSGNFSFIKSGLADGVYYLSLSNFTDDKGNTFYLRQVTDNFVVGDVQLKINLEINDTVIGDDVIADIFVFDEKDNTAIKYLDFILVVNNTEYNVTTDFNGKIHRNMGIFDVRDYTAIAYLANNEQFLSALAYDDFIVFEPSTDINIIDFDMDFSDIDYGQTVTVDVDYVEDKDENPVDGYIIVDIINSAGDEVASLNITVDEGRGSATLAELLMPGDYTLNARFYNDEMENYTSQTVTQKLTVGKDMTSISADVENITYGQDAVVDINLTGRNTGKLDGMLLYVYLDGRFYNHYYTDNGSVHIELSDLNPGDHSIEIEYQEQDSRYYGDIERLVFNVAKLSTVLSVNGSENEWGETASVSIKLTDEDGNPIEGTVIVKVQWKNNLESDVVELDSLGEGKANFILTKVAIGEYNVTATFIGNEIYESAQNNLAKIKINSTRKVNAQITVNDSADGEDVSINIVVNDASGASVPVDKLNVTINNETKEYDVDENGTVVLDYDFPLGETQIKILFDDGIHDIINMTRTVVVSPSESVDAIVTVKATDISYGETATIEFTLTQIDGTPISGNLNVRVADKESNVTVNNGTGLLRLEGLNADTYPVVANYAGLDNIKPSVGTGSFIVSKKVTQIIFEDMTTVAIDKSDVKTGQWFTWKLVDANGNPIANVPTQIGFNGVVYENILTDANGLAKLQINLAYKGPYTFAICFLGNQNYNASFAVAKITVNTQTPNIAVPNRSYKATAKTKTLTATFKSVKGTLIANKRVSFTVNGKTYSAKTNAKGVASVNVSINKKGTYAVVAKFAGDSTYSALTKKATLKLT